MVSVSLGSPKYSLTESRFLYIAVCTQENLIKYLPFIQTMRQSTFLQNVYTEVPLLVILYMNKVADL